MIVNAQIFVGNMSRAKQVALIHLSAPDLKELTGFVVHPGTGFILDPKDGPRPMACYRCGEIVTWSIEADTQAINFIGEAFVREDFVEAILGIVEDVK